MSVLENGKPDRPKRGPDLAPQYDDPGRFYVLSAAEKEAIREKARLTVQNELKDKEEKNLLAQYLQEERQAVLPEEQLVPVWLDLAGHANYVMLDGTMYMNQTLYHVTSAVFAVLTEQMSRGWAHEEETEVRDLRTRRRQRPPPHIAPGNFMDNRRERDLVVSSAALQGSTAASLLGIRA